jgi:hypothetical protein
MPPQPPEPLPDGYPTGRHQRRRRGAPDGYPTGGQSTGGQSTGGYSTGGYPGDYQEPYLEQEYQAPEQEYQAPSPPPRPGAGSVDDYPSGEYPTGAFTGGLTPLAPPGNQHDLRATGSFDAASDPMSVYERYSVYDDPRDQRRRSAYRSTGGRASRQSRGVASASAIDVPWYRETWMMALGIVAALIIGVMVGALVFGQ